MLNKQEIFNKVKKHLLAQMIQARTSDPAYGCAYRGQLTPNNEIAKCAIGCLIEDQHYTPAIEGCTMSYDRKSIVIELLDALNKSGIHPESEEEFQFLKDLQTVHDAFEPPDWVKQLEDVKSEYKLN